MTLVDAIITSLAAVQVIAIGVMVFVGTRLYDLAKRGQRVVQPPLQEVKAIAGTGKAVIDHARTDGMATFKRAKAVAEVVQRRAKTTIRIAKELKPNAQAAGTEIRAAGAELQEQREAVAQTAHKVGELARSLGRVKRAAESAQRAARESQGPEGR